MNTRDHVRDEHLPPGGSNGTGGAADAAPFRPVAALLRFRWLVLGTTLAALVLTGILLAVVPAPYVA